jgi:hypothetical protein
MKRLLSLSLLFVAAPTLASNAGLPPKFVPGGGIPTAGYIRDLSHPQPFDIDYASYEDLLGRINDLENRLSLIKNLIGQDDGQPPKSPPPLQGPCLVCATQSPHDGGSSGGTGVGSPLGGGTLHPGAGGTPK